MAINAYTDTQGRKITQNAYDSQKKAGVDVSTYKPIAATPVTQVEVKPVSTKPQQFTDPMALETVKPVETKVETQVQPQVEVQPATQITPAEPTTTQPQTMTKTDFQDNSDKAMKNILNNLKIMEKTNPELFTDKANFQKALSYGDRTDRQQLTLDTYFESKRKQSAQQQEVVNAQTETQNNIDKLNRMSAKELVEQGLTDEEQTLLQQNNPDLYNQYNKVKSDNEKLSIINGTAITEKSAIEKAIEKFTNFSTTAPTNLVAEYENKIKDLEPLQSDINTKKAELETLEISMKNILSDTRKQYEGTGATEGKIRAIASKDMEQLQEDYDIKSRAYNTLVNDYNSKSNTIDKIMNLTQQQYQNDIAARNQQMSELGFAYNLYKDTPEGMSAMAMAKYEAENPDINSTDPAKQKMALNQSLDSYYKDYGDIIQRNKAQVVSDVIKYAEDNNVSVSQALQENFIKPLQGKPEYKAATNKKYGLTNEQSIIDIGGQPYIQTKNADGTITLKLFDSTQQPGSQPTFNDSGMKGAGLRNNNPGNIKDSTFGDTIGTDDKGFAVFSTPEDGFDALVEKIKFNQTNSKSKYYGDTLLQYFQKYAPSSDNNNPNAYVKSVASQLGVDVNTKIANVDATKLAAAIAKHDSGYDYSTYGQFRGGTTGTEPTPIQQQRFQQGKIDKTGKEGLTQDQYNKIAEWNKANKGEDNPIIATILGSGKFTKDQSAAITNAINNGEDPYTVIKNQARSLMASPTATDVEAFELARGEMLNIQKLIKEYYDKGGDTGLFKGSYEKAINKLGEVDDPELVELAVNIASALQSYRNSVSGTAYSVKEGIEIENVFPGIKKSKGLNDAIIKGRLNSFNTKIDSAYANVLGQSTYNRLKTMYEEQPIQTPVKQTTPQTNYQIGAGNNNILNADINKLLNF